MMAEGGVPGLGHRCLPLASVDDGAENHEPWIAGFNDGERSPFYCASVGDVAKEEGSKDAVRSLHLVHALSRLVVGEPELGLIDEVSRGVLKILVECTGHIS